MPSQFSGPRTFETEKVDNSIHNCFRADRRIHCGGILYPWWTLQRNFHDQVYLYYTNYQKNVRQGCGRYKLLFAFSGKQRRNSHKTAVSDDKASVWITERRVDEMFKIVQSCNHPTVTYHLRLTHTDIATRPANLASRANCNSNFERSRGRDYFF